MAGLGDWGLPLEFWVGIAGGLKAFHVPAIGPEADSRVKGHSSASGHLCQKGTKVIQSQDTHTIQTHTPL